MKLQILIIEDNAIILELIRSIIDTRTDFEAVIANNGTSGVNLASSLLPDLIILDINLPDINGIEIARHLRSNEETKHIKIAALTATQLIKSYNADDLFDVVMKKPLTSQELVENLERLL